MQSSPFIRISHFLNKLNAKTSRDEAISTSFPAFVHNRKRSLLLVLLFIFLCIGFPIRNYLAFKGQALPPSLDVNIECSACNRGERPAYCKIDDTHQFSEVIWFITDGFPWYLANGTISQFADHLIPYTTIVYGTRFSHTIYTTWFTGLPSVNLFATPIEGDQLFEAAQRAGGHRCDLKKKDVAVSGTDVDKFHWMYAGPEWCPGTLLGGQRKMSYIGFSNVTFWDDKYVGGRVYKELNDYGLKNVLLKSAEKNQSIVFHSGVFDKAGHNSAKRVPKELKVLKNLFGAKDLKEFVDTHPHYLLIMSSDHGGSSVVPYLFHGTTTAGKQANVGWVAFYNPIFKSTPVREIEATDVAPTVAKYLKNVDIPFFSTGEVQNSYGDNGEESFRHALQQNLVQLGKAVRYWGTKKYVEKPQLLNADANIEEIQREIREIKEVLKYNAMSFIGWAALFAVLALSIIVLWMKSNRDVIRTLLISLPVFLVLTLVVPDVKEFYHQRYFKYWDAVSTVVLLIFGQHRYRFVLANELLGLLSFGLNSAKLGSGNQILFVPFFSIPVSYFAFTRLRPTPEKSEQKYWDIYSITNALVHVLLILFELTNSIQSLYFVAGFHFAVALLFMVQIACLCLWVGRRSPFHLLLAVTAYLLLIQRANVAVPILSFQFALVIPGLVTPSSSVRRDFGLQAAIFYINDFIFWFHAASYGQLDLEFAQDLSAGAVGVTSWNLYPTYSGFAMGFSKIGIFILAALHASSVVKTSFLLVPSVLHLTTAAMMTNWCIERYVMENLGIDVALLSCVLFGIQAIVTAIWGLFRRQEPLQYERVSSRNEYIPE